MSRRARGPQYEDRGAERGLRLVPRASDAQEPPELDEPDEPDEANEFAGDGDFDDYGANDDPAEPSGIDRLRRSLPGTMLAAAMLGVRDVLEPPKDEEIVMEVEAPGRRFDPFELHLDPDPEGNSVVIVRFPHPTPDGADGGDRR